MLSSVPRRRDNMKLRLALLAVACAGCSLPAIDAQVFKPIDRTKQADVSDKTVNFADVPVDTVSPPARDLPRKSPLSKGDLKLQDADVTTKGVDLKSLEMPAVPTEVVPKANVTTKRATVDGKKYEIKKDLDQTSQKAPITDRQIRAFTPAGEEELKKQLNNPPQH